MSSKDTPQAVTFKGYASYDRELGGYMCDCDGPILIWGSQREVLTESDEDTLIVELEVTVKPMGWVGATDADT